jgi:hypothetical protein
MSSGERAATYAALGAGGAVVVVVAGLLQRTLRPAREISRYARDVDDAVCGIARNTDAGEELTRTRDLAVAVPQLAGDYLDALAEAGS